MNANDFIDLLININENELFDINVFDVIEYNFTDNELKSEFCKYLQKNYKIKIEKWEPNKMEYPEYMFLDSDRGILAYVKFNIYKKQSIDIHKDISYDLSEIIKVVSRIESELDRPTFFINFICSPQLNLLVFETNEQIKDRLYSDEKSYNKSGNKYYVDLAYTGDLKELIKVLTGLKKDKVIIR